MQYQLLVWFKRVVRYINYFFTSDLPKENQVLETLPETTNLYDFLQKLSDYLIANFNYVSDKVDFAKHPMVFAKEKVGDCDDFALFSLWAIRNRFPNAESYIGTCYSNTSGGHAVCVVKYADKYYHVGNWGLLGGVSTLEELASSIYPDYHDFYLLSYNFTVLKHITK